MQMAAPGSVFKSRLKYKVSNKKIELFQFESVSNQLSLKWDSYGKKKKEEARKKVDTLAHLIQQWGQCI